MTAEPVGPNSMTYDGENRMTAYNNIAGYTYDGNGLRVAKSASGTATVSIFSGSSVLAEYDNGAAPSTPSREYVYGASGLLAMFSGGATTYYHQDHLGVRLTTDANGNVASQQGTFPFGESWYQSGAGDKTVFTSYDRDSESGLDYALARYYDSSTGTFCSADPLDGSPGDPQSWNRYPYGRNDPIDVTDPSGKSWWSSLLIDAGVAVAAYLAPEIAPAWFGGTSSVGGYVDLAGPSYMEGNTLVVTPMEFTWVSGGSGGLAAAIGGGMAAMAQTASPSLQSTSMRFNDCNHKFGDANSQAHLNYNGFQMAQNAANNAGIGTNQELALWDNEQSFLPTMGANSAGAVGPMQVTKSVVGDLQKYSQVPSGYATDPYANLLAGARYFKVLLTQYGLPSTKAAAAYTAGPTAIRHGQWTPHDNQYQNNFNNRSATMQNLVNCMHP